MIKSTVTSKGQTTIPRAIREELGIGTGDVLEWDIQQQHVRLRPVGNAFLRRRGAVLTGHGSVTADVAHVRRARGSAKP
jgi:AbrB family looped-hinge helix DNA binding protein